MPCIYHSCKKDVSSIAYLALEVNFQDMILKTIGLSRSYGSEKMPQKSLLYPQENQCPKKKSVRFSPFDTVRPIPNKEELSDVLADLYWSHEETQGFRESALAQIDYILSLDTSMTRTQAIRTLYQSDEFCLASNEQLSPGTKADIKAPLEYLKCEDSLTNDFCSVSDILRTDIMHGKTDAEILRGE
jgi:hypothetical protein